MVSAGDDAMMRVDAAVENHLGKGGEIAGSGKKSRVAGDAAHGPGIFVVDFALDEPSCDRSRRFPWARFAARNFARRIEERVVHAERGENFFAREVRRERRR